MDNLKKDIEDLKAVADQLLLQVSMNTVKLNVLNEMVLTVYKETLDETTWKNIHRNYFNYLNDEMKEVFSEVNQLSFQQKNLSKHAFDFHLMISEALKSLDD